MIFERLIKDSRWRQEPEETRNAMLNLSFEDEIGSDPRFGQEPEETRNAIRSLYLQDAKEFESNTYPAPERTALGTVGDVGVSAAKGIVGAGESLAGILDIPTLGLVGKSLEKLFGYDPKTTHQFLESFYSPAQQGANRKVQEAEGFWENTKSVLQNPSTIPHSVIESLPSMVGGGAIARKLLQAGIISAPIVAAAIGEGLVTSGQQAEQIRQKTPSGLLSPKQAGASILSGAITGAISLAGGRLAQKMGFADPDTLLVGIKANTNKAGVTKRILEGFVSEGIFEELPQSMQEQIWQNAALDKPLLDGVPQAGVQGAFAGAVMGAGANVLPGRKKAPSVVPPPTVDQDIRDLKTIESRQGPLSDEADLKRQDIIEKKIAEPTRIQGLGELNQRRIEQEMPLESVDYLTPEQRRQEYLTQIGMARPVTVGQAAIEEEQGAGNLRANQGQLYEEGDIGRRGPGPGGGNLQQVAPEAARPPEVIQQAPEEETPGRAPELPEQVGVPRETYDLFAVKLKDGRILTSEKSHTDAVDGMLTTDGKFVERPVEKGIEVEGAELKGKEVEAGKPVIKKVIPLSDRSKEEKQRIEDYNKKMNSEEWVRAYEDEVDMQHFTKEEGHSPLADELIRDLEKDGLKKGANVLEIGSGQGRDSAFIAKSGHTVRGIDVSDKAVKIASERAKGLDASFDVGDAENLYQFENESQDAVYSVAALHGTPIKFTFAEVFRVLKPGGQAKLFLYTKTKTGSKWISYWTPGEIKQYAEEAGFKIEKFREGKDAEPIEIPGVSGKVEQETHLVVTTLRKPKKEARPDTPQPTAPLFEMVEPSTQVERQKERIIGKNNEGDTIGEDNGGRFILVGTSKMYTPRRVGPQGEKFKPYSPKDLYDRGRITYLTKEEVEQFSGKPKTEPSLKTEIDWNLVNKAVELFNKTKERVSDARASDHLKNVVNMMNDATLKQYRDKTGTETPQTVESSPPLARPEKAPIIKNIGTIGNFNIPALSDLFLEKIRSGEMPKNKIDVQVIVAKALGIKRSVMLN
ncbi:MAG: class I SAM-dependent methyltransferase, partial [Pseudomonadota bacterium]